MSGFEADNAVRHIAHVGYIFCRMVHELGHLQNRGVLHSERSILVRILHSSCGRKGCTDALRL